MNTYLERINTMKKCIKCKAELEDEVQFCTQCGAKQPKVKVCPHCNKYIAEDSTFCPECGKSLIVKKEKPSAAIWWIISVAAAILIAIAVFVIMKLNSSDSAQGLESAGIESTAGAGANAADAASGKKSAKMHWMSAILEVKDPLSITSIEYVEPGVDWVEYKMGDVIKFKDGECINLEDWFGEDTQIEYEGDTCISINYMMLCCTVIYNGNKIKSRSVGFPIGQADYDYEEYNESGYVSSVRKMTYYRSTMSSESQLYFVDNYVYDKHGNWTSRTFSTLHEEFVERRIIKYKGEKGTETKAKADEGAVDLGLSVLWSKYNLGASEYNIHGSLYGWGNANVSVSNSSKDLSLFPCSNPPSCISRTQYDIAKNELGGSWRMPTIAELQELVDKCRWNLHDSGDDSYYRVTGPNGNYIDLPLDGYAVGGEKKSVGTWGFVWSANLYNGNSQYGANLTFSKKGDISTSGYFRYGRQSVRPVMDK